MCGRCKERAPDSPALLRYKEIAQPLTGDPIALANNGIAWVMALVEALQVQPLSQFGISAADFPEIATKSLSG